MFSAQQIQNFKTVKATSSASHPRCSTACTHHRCCFVRVGRLVAAFGADALFLDAAWAFDDFAFAAESAMCSLSFAAFSRSFCLCARPCTAFSPAFATVASSVFR
jgi:hypothetical protein